MRRSVTFAVICALSLGVFGVVRADQISIAADTNAPDMPIDLSLRDADLGEVLSALFNTTNGKYQLQVGNGVVGRIARLQFTHQPFEDALKSVLGSEYSWTKANQPGGTYLYRIYGRQNAGDNTKPVTGIAPVFAPPTASVPAVTTATGTTNVVGAAPNAANTGFPILSLITKSSGSTDKTAGGTAAKEDSVNVVKLIGISHLDMDAICTALGGTTLALFAQDSYGGGSSGGGTTTDANGNTINNNTNNSLNNGTNNNNLNNSLNNTQNTTNRTTRTTRTTNNTSGVL